MFFLERRMPVKNGEGTPKTLPENPTYIKQARANRGFSGPFLRERGPEGGGGKEGGKVGVGMLAN